MEFWCREAETCKDSDKTLAAEGIYEVQLAKSYWSSLYSSLHEDGLDWLAEPMQFFARGQDIHRPWVEKCNTVSPGIDDTDAISKNGLPQLRKLYCWNAIDQLNLHLEF